MLNLCGPGPLVFSRPFSILAADGATVSFLYRVVGRGTAALARPAVRASGSASSDRWGDPFPAPAADAPAVLLAGGVGLPPVHAWLARHGGPADLAFFGARDGADVPWDLLGDRWHVSVDDPTGVPDERSAWHGLVTDSGRRRHLPPLAGPAHACWPADRCRCCGRRPRLAAAARLGLLALPRGAHGLRLRRLQGLRGAGARPGGRRTGWRNATCCEEGPVFRADTIAWERHGRPAGAGRASGPEPHHGPGPGTGTAVPLPAWWTTDPGAPFVLGPREFPGPHLDGVRLLRLRADRPTT